MKQMNRSPVVVGIGMRMLAVSLVAARRRCLRVWPRRTTFREITSLNISSYTVIDMGTFGGSESLFSNPGSNVINDRGVATGFAATSIPDPYAPNCAFDCLIDHGFVWRNGNRIELGSLPGGASNFPVVDHAIAGCTAGASQERRN